MTSVDHSTRSVSITSPAMARLLAALAPDAWRAEAQCRGAAAVDFFAPFEGESRRQRAARERRAVAVCATCPVQARCLEDAARRGERYGIWGGRAFDERTSLMHQPPLPDYLLRPTA